MLGGILPILAPSMPSARACPATSRACPPRSGVLAAGVFVFASDFRFALGAFLGGFGFLFGAFLGGFPFVFGAIRSTRVLALPAVLAFRAVVAGGFGVLAAFGFGAAARSSPR